MSYMWNFTDNAGNSNSTGIQNITTTADSTGPVNSHINQNSTRQGSGCLIYSNWTDDSSLSHFIVEHNNTGSVSNETASAFSGAWANFSFTLNSTFQQSIVYRVFANDSLDNWGVSDYMTIGMYSNLYIEGVNIKRTNDTATVQLKGYQKHGYEDIPGGKWNGQTWDYHNTTAIGLHLDEMKDNWGANEVRIIYDVSYWVEDDAASSGEGFREIVGDIMDLAEARDMTVVLCGFSIESGSGYHYPPWHNTYFAIGSNTTLGFEYFLANWTSMVSTLRGHPNAIFEIWNEVPNNEDDWLTGCETIIAATANITNHLVIVQFQYDTWVRYNADWSINDRYRITDWATDSRVDYPNVLISTHIYHDARGIWLEDGENETWLSTTDNVTQAFTDENLYYWLTTVQRPLYIGEYGPWAVEASMPTDDVWNSTQRGLEILLGWNVSVNVMWWSAINPPDGNYSMWDGAWDFNPSDPYGLMIQESMTEDGNPPTFSAVSANSSVAGQSVALSVTVSDAAAVSHFIYSWNNTGSWVNQTTTAFGGNPCQLEGTWNSTIGVVVSVKVYANDTSDNWGVSSQYNFTLTGDLEPTYSGLSVSTTLTGTVCEFSVTVDDDVALEGNGQYQFGTNNTGSWVWDAAVNFSSTPQTVSVSKTLNSSVGVTVAYMWNFTDNVGNSNSTGVQTLLTTVTQLSDSTGFTNPLFQYILTGDYLYFVVACYTSVLGSAFFGLVVFFFSAVIYLRTKNLFLVGLMYLLLGPTYLVLFWDLSFIAVLFTVVGVASVFVELILVWRSRPGY